MKQKELINFVFEFLRWTELITSLFFSIKLNVFEHCLTQ